MSTRNHRQWVLIQQLLFLIDEHLNRQVNCILHHVEFQTLEASWRGLYLLVQAAGESQVIIKYFNLSLSALAREMDHAIDFDQSVLFKKIYHEEFDQPGGQPFGLLIGDYYFSHKPSKQVRDNIHLLTELSKIAASAFCPMIFAVSPNFFGIDSYHELQVPFKVDDLLQQAEYQRWKKLRELEETRYLGLVLPRIRMRKVYNRQINIDNRDFVETITQHEDYLWGNAVYPYACTVITAFKETGWFSDIRGINPTLGTGGMVATFREDSQLDDDNFIAKAAIDYAITDMQEKILQDAGFIALRDNRYLRKVIFYSSQSLQKPQRYTTKAGTVNAKISSLINYLLCASRFAHYIKVIMRDKTGSFISAKECEIFLDRWLHQYQSKNADTSISARCQYPLNNASVKVKESPVNPGKYVCTMHIKPHYQIDDIESQLKLSMHLT